MPGDNLHRCYPPRRIGKSLLNDQRLGKLYSFLHFSTRSSLRGTLLTVPLSAFSLQLAALAEIRKVIRVFTHASSPRSFLRPVYQVFTHEFLFFSLKRELLHLFYMLVRINSIEIHLQTSHVSLLTIVPIEHTRFRSTIPRTGRQLGNLSSSNGKSINVSSSHEVKEQPVRIH